MIRTYSEMIALPTFEERYNYLKLNGVVGSDTFGFDRHINQDFYHSREWQNVRRKVILRDEACDLGISDREIGGRLIIHHMNPIRIGDIVDYSQYLMNPEYLICVSHKTHNAIHYGDEELIKDYVKRTPNDMCPWK